MRRLIRLIAAAALLGGLFMLSPQAHASGSPDVCAVDGSVALTPALSNTPSTSAGSYSFGSTTLTCAGGSHAGTYHLTSNGSRSSGEDCTGGSGSGSLSGSGPNGSVSGSVSFTRNGSVVRASGSVSDSSGSHSFTAVLQFTPNAPQNCFVTPVSNARITGAAVLQ
jgi:hypothetical protein